jgi:polyhydroxybutyrate depolymerase
VKRGESRLLLALPLLANIGAGCSQADLYPITRQAGAETGTGGLAGGAAAGQNGGMTARGGASGTSSGAGGNGGVAGSAPACALPVLAAGDSTQTVVVGGAMRTYVLHVPAAYDGARPVPLVLDFHGIGQSGAKERASSPYPAALDPAGVIMAFPDGLHGPAGAAWNVGPCCVSNVDDVGFARALVAQVSGLACIEPTRVYAVGLLTGGGMAHYLACQAADVFAAVAPAAFDLLAENVAECVPARPITVISFRGTADPRVPYDGGPSSLVPGLPITFLGAQGTFEKWAAINHCVGPASSPDADGCSAYSGCGGGVEVILCTKQGGGEDPGDPSIAWPVLDRHTL